ncbi:hypothetical protein [Mariprofundus sp. KV]|uniref:hypothetical protein n=1 Tax=Mariprofundus sp. KV TaxID=2608715 RepID=UPI0015A02F1E|nr:hypothetical protein [Mariprofundus sp. KV]NWF35316.1 hypothetical protein [Mariprofundus sp. KV]
MKKAWIMLSTLGAMLMFHSNAMAGETVISINNQSGMRLHVYAAGLTEVAQMAPGKWAHITLPLNYRYRGSTFSTMQLMVVGGGSWTADRSGWTTYAHMKTCAIHEFKRNAGKLTWNITGTAMTCNGPRGYRQ